MKNYELEEINFLIKRFESKELPKPEWTHEAHLLVAIWYASNYKLPKSLDLVRDKIIAHNESVGTPNSDTEGYHETITRFWMLTAERFLTNRNRGELKENINDFINSKEGYSKFPLEFYSTDLLFSVNARHNWVDPDLKAL